MYDCSKETPNLSIKIDRWIDCGIQITNRQRKGEYSSFLSNGLSTLWYGASVGLMNDEQDSADKTYSATVI
eukprot:scaffold4834_cov67-Skeletonema_dohrnii-CCMP3373.AAC.1